MVRVNAPALSLDASGSLAGSLTYSKWKGRNYVRSLVIPSNPKSGAQVGVRSMFRFLTQIWNGLTDGNKATWEDRADASAISPFNAFMGYNQFRWRNFLGPSKEDPADPQADTSTMGALSAVAGIRSITVTQAVTVAGNAWGIAFFRSPTGTFETGFTNLVRVLPVDGTNDVVFVDSPLDPGTYYYDTRPFTVDGTLGAETGEQSDTVV